MEGEITVWHWVGFVSAVVVLLALDLGVFHRRAREVRFREAMGWTALWVLMALSFGLWMYRGGSREEGLEFLTGYLIELSLWTLPPGEYRIAVALTNPDTDERLPAFDSTGQPLPDNRYIFSETIQLTTNELTK